MSPLSHYERCGRRLRDAIFCPRCGQCLCSFACLDVHIAGHQGPDSVARQLDEARRCVRLLEGPVLGE